MGRGGARAIFSFSGESDDVTSDSSANNTNTKCTIRNKDREENFVKKSL